MLTMLGKASIAIVMAGGMLLLGGDSAIAGSSNCGSVPEYPVACDATIDALACSYTAAHSYFEGGSTGAPSTTASARCGVTTVRSTISGPSRTTTTE